MQLDEELVNDMMGSFSELFEELGSALVELSVGGLSELDAMFRAIHSIKGNAAMVRRQVLVDYTHSVEEVVEALRAFRYEASPPICEAIQYGLEVLSDLHQREIQGQEFGDLHEVALEKMFRRLAVAEPANADRVALDIVSKIESGFAAVEEEQKFDESAFECVARDESQEREQFDLSFFEEMSAQIDLQCSHWQGRSQRMLEWALKMNELGGNVVIANQLAAAVFMHDIGMAFLPLAVVQKGNAAALDDCDRLRVHPSWGYNYLQRIPGWDEAATIVLEHHEYINGTGYPNGIKGEYIHPGAKIMCILDAYYGMAYEQSFEPDRRVIMHAIGEINADVGNLYDEAWVRCFNSLMKAEVKQGNM